MTSLDPVSAPARGNNFGFLRLSFAILVIISHSPQLIDGNASREPWQQIFGPPFTLGGLAVDGFFLISGYLITKSFLTSTTTLDYLMKRVLRIYPGFLVAFAVSLALVGWLAGGNLSALSVTDWLKQIVYALLLNDPSLDGAFAHLPEPALNGSLWTIAHEFRCYLFVIALGGLGILRRRWTYLAITLLLIPIGLSYSFDLRLPAALYRPYADIVPYYYFPNTNVGDLLRFLPIFLMGGAFYLFRDRIVYTGKGAAAAAVLLLPALFNPHTVEIGLCTLGAYILFWFSFRGAKALNGVGTRADLSYGIYLYAWPVQSLFILYDPAISPWVLSLLATLISAALAYVSWTFVEHPALRLKDKLRPPVSRNRAAGFVS